MSQPAHKTSNNVGKDLHADLPVRRQWIEEGRRIPVGTGRRNIELAGRRSCNVIRAEVVKVEVLTWSNSGWPAVLQLAEDYGWQPAGTHASEENQARRLGRRLLVV